MLARRNIIIDYARGDISGLRLISPISNSIAAANTTSLAARVAAHDTRRYPLPFRLRA